jgi:osmotically-inducible protein OsmY
MASQTSTRSGGFGLSGLFGFISERRPGVKGQQARIRNRVKRVPGLPKGSVSVELWEGVVMLKGEVPSAELRDEVERAAATLYPAQRINNFLRVLPSAGSASS